MTLQVIALAGLLIACMGPLSVVYFLCMLRQPKDSRQGSISIVLALTGPSPRLASLFAALAQQQLQPRRLIIAVESEDDPAFLRVQACRGMVPFPVDLVVAGLAEHRSQKSKNLLAALSLIDDQDKVVVLFDADIAPTAEWLGYLCSPILSGNFDVVSGYRWQWQTDWRLAQLFITTIDHAIALLPRPPGYFLPWGGSVALGREALQGIDRQQWLGGSISDDCALGLEVNRLGLRALVRRVLLVKSPIEGTFASLWLFGRRQYQMIRFYTPLLWWFALVTVGVRSAAWCLFLLPVGMPLAWFGLASMYAATVIGAVLQQKVRYRLSLQDAGDVGQPLCLSIILKPVIDLVHLSLILGSAWSRVVTWGHVRYRVASRTNIAVVARKTWKN